MATNTKLGGVFTTDTDGNLSSSLMVSTENVCGIIFDTKAVGGLAAALGSGDAATRFADGNVVELNTSKDVEEAGIDSTVMHGLPYYHLNQFFTLAGNNKRLFVSFMDSSNDPNFTAVEKMQVASGGIIYQIGVWTGEAIANAPSGNSNTDYTLKENSVITRLQTQAELLGGKVNQTNYDGNSPLNILLNAPIVNAATCDYEKLPDIANLNCPKVSMLIGQSAGDNVHEIMLNINSGDTPTYAPVGNIGAAMAVLAIAPAHESIGYVNNYNLVSSITSAELGFGNLAINNAKTAWEASASFTNMKTLGYIKRNVKLHSKGYIFLMNYDGLENGIFFSSDQTLAADSDYRTIARCRVMHKSRRVVRRALLPFVNSPIELNASTGEISASAITQFQNVVLDAIDKNLVSPTDGRTPQISGRQCTIDANQNILDNDELLITYLMVPLGLVSGIYVTEGFTKSIAAY